MKYLKPLRRTEEERILQAIANGLSILRSEQGLGWIATEIEIQDKRKIEDKVSRVLYRCLEQARNNLKRVGQGLMGTLSWQLPYNQIRICRMRNTKIISQTFLGRFLIMYMT